jgi:molecular chaperone GrpE
MIDEEKQMGDTQEPAYTADASAMDPSSPDADILDAIPTEVVEAEPDAVSETVAVENAADDAADDAAEGLSMEEFLSAPDDEDSANVASTDDATGTESTAELEALRQEIESLKVQLERRTSDYMRLAADFENFRKRTSKEREELDERARCTTVTELLPVVDNFERARSQIKPQNEGEMAIHKSYQGVYKQLVDGLKRLGVSPMRAEGQEFDPNLHEAVMREPSHEFPEGTVIEELMRGYLLGDRILRHAMVKVAVAPDGDEPVSGDASEP